jgi:membrane associated rhomboid family serine protease
MKRGSFRIVYYCCILNFALSVIYIFLNYSSLRSFFWRVRLGRFSDIVFLIMLLSSFIGFIVCLLNSKYLSKKKSADRINEDYKQHVNDIYDLIHRSQK